MGKKMMSFFIVMVMVLFMSMTAFANEEVIETDVTISKKEAMEIGKKFLKKHFNTNINEKTCEITIELYENGPYTAWKIEWKKIKETNGFSSIEFCISAEIDIDSGNVLACTRHSYSFNEDTRLQPMSEEEVKKKAQEHLKRIHPKKVKSVRLIDDYDKRGYYDFEYVRQINGVDFPDNRISLSIHNVNGELLDYRITWDYNMEYEDTKDVIGKEEARKLLESKVIMGKDYVETEDEENGKTVKLVYRPINIIDYKVDAKNKRFRDIIGVTYKEDEDISNERKEKIHANGASIKKEKVNRKRAEEIGDIFLKYIYEDHMEMYSIEYLDRSGYKTSYGKPLTSKWVIEFGNKSKKLYGYLVINANTGELLNLKIHNKGEKIKASEEELNSDNAEKNHHMAYNKAIYIISKLYPNKIKHMNTIKPEYVAMLDEEMGWYYSFGFSRKENGIIFDENSINVKICEKDRKVKSIYFKWNDNIEFPSSNGKVSEEEGRKLWLENLECKLVYSKSLHFSKNRKINLVYVLKKKFDEMEMIDANNGMIMDYEGRYLPLF